MKLDPLDEYELPLPDKGTFHKADVDTKLSLLYDLQCIGLRNQAKLVKHFERRRRIDTGVAGTMGLVGGMISVILAKVLRIF
jgi:DNA polymerase sigma